MEETLYEGLAIGGPMDGREIESRFPGGVLFISKATNKCWLYDYYAESARYIARPASYDAVWDQMGDEQKMKVLQETVLSGVDPTRELDYESRLAAAESFNTEVRALPDEAREVV